MNSSNLTKNIAINVYFNIGFRYIYNLLSCFFNKAKTIYCSLFNILATKNICIIAMAMEIVLCKPALTETAQRFH